jgi:hypothetical protein
MLRGKSDDLSLSTIHWIVDCERETGITLCQRLEVDFVPDEVAGVEPSIKRYTVVSIHLKRVWADYGDQQLEREFVISAGRHLAPIGCHHETESKNR